MPVRSLIAKRTKERSSTRPSVSETKESPDCEIPERMMFQMTPFPQSRSSFFVSGTPTGSGVKKASSARKFPATQSKNSPRQSRKSPAPRQFAFADSSVSCIFLLTAVCSTTAQSFGRPVRQIPKECASKYTNAAGSCEYEIHLTKDQPNNSAKDTDRHISKG